METSLRLRGGGGGGGSNDGGLRIHAKERLPLGSNALLQAHAEVDTTTGAPSYLAVLVRHFSPLFSANVGVGIHLHSPSATAGGHDFTYSIRAKKAIPFTSKGFLGIIFKTRLLADKQFNPTKRTGAFEFACDIFDFRKDQDVRLKLGYELYHKATISFTISFFYALQHPTPQSAACLFFSFRENLGKQPKYSLKGRRKGLPPPGSLSAHMKCGRVQIL